ncbi:hypothetical protein [Cecembia calidifontis]|uniref:Uncharacterized protein n=1 Tax=Cecembia calidifontis TaxID=1187080 RepID=A0A4Q7P8Q4_9BACT|nr:hypothetical protein [Cecembia calidifontis]RZS96504.1 hypothetical protein BC751_2079 [Cecembia calidifontis]
MLKYPLIYIFHKSYQAIKKHLLIIILTQMAAIRAEKVTALLNLRSHPFHMGRIHGIMPGSDNQGWNFNPDCSF